MRLLPVFGAVVLAVAILPAGGPFPAPAAAQTQAQAQLPMEKLAVVTSRGRFEFDVEIADDPDEQSMGLMFRESMPARQGMLFDFGETRMVTMWMKNTPLPLDMVFIRPDGTVARVAERTTPYSEDIVSSGEPVSHVLELNAGIANMIGLKAGDRVEQRLIGG